MGVKEEVRAGFISASAYILLERLAKFIVAEIGKIWLVDDEQRKLKKVVSRIMAMIEYVEVGNWSCFSGDNSKKAWQLWLEDVKTLSYVAGDLLEEISVLLDHHTKSKLATDASSSLAPTKVAITSKQHSLRNEILTSGRLDMPHEISNLRRKLEDLAGEMDKLLSFESFKSEKTAELVTSPGSTSLVDDSLIFGREIQKVEIVSKLVSDLYITNNNLSLISIVGMGGLGKTTLAQLVYNDDKVRNSFALRIWVSVSLDFDVIRVTRSIIESVTKKSCALMDLDPLQAKLRELLRGKRFLLILDNLWSEKYNDWEVLSTPLRFGSKGSKVIITTRNRGVSDVVGSDPYMLSLLPDSDCWNLMKQRANLENIVGGEENVDTIGLELAKKCKGLPLAAKVLGITMNCIPFKEWDAILKSDLWDLTSCRDGIFPVLALSYYNLSKELKRCFVYCALFPATHKFEEDKLVLLWLAEGFIQPTGETSLECIGKQYFKDLVCRSFFYSNPVEKKNKYKMHDFFYQMAQFISSDISLQMEDESLACYPSLQNIRHLSLCCSNLLSVDFMKEFPKCKRLRTFLLRCRNDNAGFDQGTVYLLKKFNMLRVLDLSQGRITELPPTSNGLKHLRYLNVSGNPLRNIPDWIDQLFYLETLMLNRCEGVKSLPECLRNMGNLRHLQFYKCGEILHMPSEFAELINLQTLSTFVVGKDDGYTIVELKKMARLKGSLQLFRLENVRDEFQVVEANLPMMSCLEELELEWTVPTEMIHAELVLGQIQFHENVKKLTITNYYGLAFPGSWLNVSGSKLKSIHLKGCSLCSFLPSLGRLQLLESLCIEEMQAVVTVETDFFRGFPSLKSLEFRNMRNLTACVVEDPGCMPSLHVLTCNDCLSLESLPSLGFFGSVIILKIKYCPALRSLPEMLPVSLQKLDVRGSTIVEGRCAEDGADWQRIRAIPGLRIVTSRPS